MQWNRKVTNLFDFLSETSNNFRVNQIWIKRKFIKKIKEEETKKSEENKYTEKMVPGLIYENPLEYVYTLLLDILVCTVKSIYFLLETIFLTLLPDRLRKKKVMKEDLLIVWTLDVILKLFGCSIWSIICSGSHTLY